MCNWWPVLNRLLSPEPRHTSSPSCNLEYPACYSLLKTLALRSVLSISLDKYRVNYLVVGASRVTSRRVLQIYNASRSLDKQIVSLFDRLTLWQSAGVVFYGIGNSIARWKLVGWIQIAYNISMVASSGANDWEIVKQEVTLHGKQSSIYGK